MTKSTYQYVLLRSMAVYGGIWQYMPRLNSITVYASGTCYGITLAWRYMALLFAVYHGLWQYIAVQGLDLRRGPEGGGFPGRFSCSFESAALPTLFVATASSHCKHKLIYSCFSLGLFGTPPPPLARGPPLPPAAGELAAAAAGSAAAAASSAASLVCALGRWSWCQVGGLVVMN